MRCGFARRVLDVASRPRAGQQRHAASSRQLARGVLQAEGAHLLRRRSDEHDAGVLAGLGEAGILRQEAVARMDRFGAGLPCGVEDRVDLRDSFRQRARDRCATASSACMHVQRMAVGLGIDGDARDAHPSSVRMMRQAIAPRLAIRTLRNMRVTRPLPQISTWIGVGL